MIIEFADLLLGVLGYNFLITGMCVVFVFILLRQAWLKQFDLVFLGMLFCIIPALTPFLTVFSGFKYFTAMNYDLQTPARIVAASLVIGLFFGGLIFGASLPQLKRTTDPLMRPFVFPEYAFIILIGINLIMVILFLEAGTILYGSYADFKLNQETPYSSLANQVFNLSIAVLISSAPNDRRRKIIMWVCAILILYSLIIARRNMTVGLVILVLYFIGGARLSPKQIGLGFSAMILLVVIGEARKVGLATYFLEAHSTLPGNWVQLYYSMPGGGANIFLAVIGVIELNLTDQLRGFEKMPILLWPSGVNESVIYSRSGFVYNGGMHIAAVFYWNFGIIGVIWGGALSGWILRLADSFLRTLNRPYTGGFGFAFSVYVVLMLSNTFWYGPIGFTKGTFALIVFYVVVHFLPRKGDIKFVKKNGSRTS